MMFMITVAMMVMMRMVVLRRILVAEKRGGGRVGNGGFRPTIRHLEAQWAAE